MLIHPHIRPCLTQQGPRKELHPDRQGKFALPYHFAIKLEVLRHSTLGKTLPFSGVYNRAFPPQAKFVDYEEYQDVGTVLGFTYTVMHMKVDKSQREYLDAQRFEVVLILEFPHATTYSQQSLGWHTASINTSPSHYISFYDCSFQTLPQATPPLEIRVIQSHSLFKNIAANSHKRFCMMIRIS